MLSDDYINSVVDELVVRQANVSNYVVNIIANRIKEIGTILPSDVYRLERLLKMGGDVQKINAELARVTRLQVRDIKQLIKSVAYGAYIDVRPFYDYRNLPYIPFNKNIELQRVVTAIANQTANSYVNLARAQAFMLRDPANPTRLIPTSISQTYYTSIDTAVHAVRGGVTDYQKAMQQTIEDLVDSGIQHVTYQAESGRFHSQRLDTAVRRNILDGIRAINQGVQDEVGKQFDADGKEITVHANSAPDHEPIQGHQFTNTEFDKLQTEQAFEDIDGEKFEPIRRPIGVLNCRHFVYSIIVGVTKPNFTKEQLQEYIRKNHEGYTMANGKHLTMYECTQYQRALETQIRRAKDGQVAARQAGMDELAKQYQRKVDERTRNYDTFSKACGLSLKTKRIQVAGYRQIKV